MCFVQLPSRQGLVLPNPKTIFKLVEVGSFHTTRDPGPETLLHAILALHEKIRTGELTQRRKQTGAGAEIELGQEHAPDAQPEPVIIRTGGLDE